MRIKGFRRPALSHHWGLPEVFSSQLRAWGGGAPLQPFSAACKDARRAQWGCKGTLRPNPRLGVASSIGSRSHMDVRRAPTPAANMIRPDKKKEGF